jgi:hypothetical protein
MASNILVLGAGELGVPVLTSLAKQAPPSTKISVLLRQSTISSPSASKAVEHITLKSLGISLVSGDIASSSVPSLAELFKPYDLIISCLGFAAGIGSSTKIAQAVLLAGVKRFIPWQFGVDYDVIGRGSPQPLFDEQLDIRDLLRGQTGSEWIIISTGMFTSFLFEAYFGVVDLDYGQGQGIVRALGGWQNRVTLTTPEDIGKLTAAIVFEENPTVKNEIVYTAGETISYGQVADLVDQVLGKKVQREVWTVEALKEELRKDPENVVRRYRAVFAEGRGCFWDKEGTFNAKKGIEVEDVRGWMVKNLKK